MIFEGSCLLGVVPHIKTTLPLMDGGITVEVVTDEVAELMQHLETKSNHKRCFRRYPISHIKKPQFTKRMKSKILRLRIQVIQLGKETQQT